MNEISVHFLDYDSWSITGTTYWKGSAFFEERLLDDSSIACMFSSIKNADDFISSIKQLNGFFAVVQQKEDTIYAAVDRVRSFPLFYSLKDGDFYISDDPLWIQKEIQAEEVDEIAAAEFMLTGYVTGSDTLYPDIKQLKAGEALALERSSEGPRFKKVRYYQYIPGKYSTSSEEALLSELDRILVKVFERLIKLASGRTIVVPLSGGYDSRLIVLMLKRLGYKNVVTFSYGKPGNKESEISKKIADILGIQWEFISYSNKDWHKWYRSEEYQRYSRMACGLSSVPHIQDWPAVWELRKNGIIPIESIIVPGHSADLLTGSRSSGQPKLYDEKAETFDPIEAILRYHYCLWHMSEDQVYRFQFKDRIASCIGDIRQFADNAGVFECWDVSERQSKFIINSLRVYEFWGYSWWMPFWDKEFMDFWSQIPIDTKLGQKIYKEYVNNLFNRILNTYIGTNHEIEAGRALLLKSAISILKRTPFLSVARNIYRRYKLIGAYDSSPLAFYGAIPKERFAKMYTGVENINSFIAADIMDSLSSDSENAKKVLHEIVIAEK
jgi:asparagine synthase (glutamine-hydrolysing)